MISRGVIKTSSFPSSTFSSCSPRFVVLFSKNAARESASSSSDTFLASTAHVRLLLHHLLFLTGDTTFCARRLVEGTPTVIVLVLDKVNFCWCWCWCWWYIVVGKSSSKKALLLFVCTQLRTTTTTNNNEQQRTTTNNNEQQ